MTALTILFLVFLEGILSFDNALVLAVLANKLPEADRKKALTYGMWGAIGFRFLALGLLVFLLQSIWIKFVGAGYLFYLAGDHFFGSDSDDDAKEGHTSFWKTVLMVELTDIAFSSDSILASVGVSHDFWVVFTGGMLGIIMMRVAAILFIRLLQIFPGLETSAYVLIAIIGGKLLAEGCGVNCDVSEIRGLFMALGGFALASGFLPRKSTT
jgi:YkoY family integral membrane protein